VSVIIRIAGKHSKWQTAKVILPAIYNPWGNRTLEHELRPDPLPQMERRTEQFKRFLTSNGPEQDYKPCRLPLRIAPHSRKQIILDRGELTNAYPLICVSGGRDALITMVGAEAPRSPDALRIKGNRDEINGKVFRGTVDEFICDGGRRRTFSTDWFRSFRYLMLEINTAGESLLLHSAECSFSGYPLRNTSRLTSTGNENRRLRRWHEITRRTQQLCSHETFFDCPHYEQGQFPGDTRIQAVYHYLAANDDRLVRKAIDDFHASRNPEGLLSSHHPLNSFHAIPTFSLQWIGILYDFLLYRGDDVFLNRYLPAAREILAWFERRMAADGMLGFIPDAPFVDWTAAFESGNAPQDSNGHSAILTLLFAQACERQAAMEKAAGFAELQKRYRLMSQRLVTATRQLCWNGRRGLLADTPRGRSFSRHAQTEAVLAGMWPAAVARKVLLNAEAEKNITPEGTLYYTYYVIQALKAAGLPQIACERLNAWDRCLHGTGLTTWPETLNENTRSDCHAWSVTPGIENFQLLAGISPAANGFSCLRINPLPGLTAPLKVRLTIPAGDVLAEIRPMKTGRIKIHISSPVPVISGKQRLPPGSHVIT
jgi:alpha-L-rhamnosidase